METIVASAWTADWMMGWLASIGVTYRDPTIKLSWTEEAVPRAVFHAAGGRAQIEAIVDASEWLSASASTRTRPGAEELPRKPNPSQYRNRCEIAREIGDLSVGAALSNIGCDPADELPHSPLDAPVPKGITLAERAEAAALSAQGADIALSFAGEGRTSNGNGLGLDLRRLASRAVPGKPLWTDPVVETLAYFGIMAFSQCGDRTRGWADGSIFERGAFRWAAWKAGLDWCGIDAYLDHFYACSNDALSITIGVFESVAYRPTGSADTTRGYDGVAAGS